jgi:F0F1-type ATP synthase alpha subunit
VREFEKEFIEFVERQENNPIKAIAEKKDLTDEIASELKKLATQFSETFKAKHHQ